MRKLEIAVWSALIVWAVAALWPASYWYNAGVFEASDFQQGDPEPHLKYTGGVVRPFIGSYTVIVREVATGAVVYEDVSGRFQYKTGTTRPDHLTIDWWAPRMAAQYKALPPGDYAIQACWSIYGRFWGLAPVKTTCHTPVSFHSVRMKLALALIMLATSASGIALSPAASPALSAQCGEYEAVRKILREKYGEVRFFIGADSTGRILEIWRNPKTGSWTAVIVTAEGNACVPASGRLSKIEAPGTDV